MYFERLQSIFQGIYFASLQGTSQGIILRFFRTPFSTFILKLFMTPFRALILRLFRTPFRASILRFFRARFRASVLRLFGASCRKPILRIIKTNLEPRMRWGPLACNLEHRQVFRCPPLRTFRIRFKPCDARALTCCVIRVNGDRNLAITSWQMFKRHARCHCACAGRALSHGHKLRKVCMMLRGGTCGKEYFIYAPPWVAKKVRLQRSVDLKSRGVTAHGCTPAP